MLESHVQGETSSIITTIHSILTTFPASGSRLAYFWLFAEALRGLNVAFVTNMGRE